MEELEEALSNKGLTVSSVPEKGRCLFTTRDFSPGEVIISEEPYVSVPNKSAKCEWCFNSSNLKRCSSCQVVYYCGNTCQKSDWKLHRVECQALSKVERIKSLTPTIRLMVKLYLRRKLQDEKVFPVTVMDNYNLVESLVSHMSDIDEKQLVLYAQMANLVSLILQWPEINVKEIAENFSKFSCNAHTICDAELKPLGTGLYPVVSIINHSCLPNSVLIFEGRMAVVRAVQHIPKGTEVSISYIEMAGSTATRQKALKEQYLFSCTCIRCIKLGQNNDIQESAVLEGYRCKDKRCSGFLLRDSGNKGFTCQLCGLFRDKEEIKNIVNEIQSLSEKASFSLSLGYNKDARVMYKMIEKLQLKLYHPLSINLMHTWENLLKILMELQDWMEALKYCRLTIPVYQILIVSNLSKLEFVALNIFGKNCLSWVLDAEIHLDAKGHGTTITKGNEALIQDKAKAMIFLRHHLDEGLKVEYLTVKDPLELWTSLKERYDHLKATILPMARYEWIHLRLLDFETVCEYNSTVYKITSQLKLCGENITDDDMLEKTYYFSYLKSGITVAIS